MLLKNYRALHGLTQAEFAKLIKSKQPRVADWEAGRSVPRAKTARRILEVTGGQVTPNDFYGVAAEQVAA